MSLIDLNASKELQLNQLDMVALARISIEEFPPLQRVFLSAEPAYFPVNILSMYM